MPHFEWDLENASAGPRVLVWGEVRHMDVDAACPLQLRVDWRGPALPLSGTRDGERGIAYTLSKRFARAGLSDRFTRDEVTSVYVTGKERYVVSLVMGYVHDAEDGATSPEEAAALALSLVLDGPESGTVWQVHDRETGLTWPIEQGRPEMVKAWRHREAHMNQLHPISRMLSSDELLERQGLPVPVRWVEALGADDEVMARVIVGPKAPGRDQILIDKDGHVYERRPTGIGPRLRFQAKSGPYAGMYVEVKLVEFEKAGGRP